MLKIDDLKIQFNDEESPTVKGISFSMGKGEILGIVGESGSGKTITSLCLAGLTPGNAAATGSIELDNMDILKLSKEERRKIMGKKISMVFQEPMTSLNPLMKVGKQVEEMLVLHSENGKQLSKLDRKKLVIEAFEDVELDNAAEVYSKNPHELSGGMQQRVMIAMALICNPEILIADEPTTALDADIQEQILVLLKKLNKEKGTSILFISHDLNVIRKLCDNVAVMCLGEIVEKGNADEIFLNPQHEYTKQLIEAANLRTKEQLQQSEEIILSVKDLTIFYKEKSKRFFGKDSKVTVCENINFNIMKGEILGLVGKSGGGKTSISKAILGLHKDYTGEIIHYSEMPQMIFQDTLGALNPSKRVIWILEEPLKAKGEKSKEVRHEKVFEMLSKVGIDKELADRYPSELSGGQRQRVNIALSLISGSKFIIADEPVSALDVTIQAQIIDLLLKLQKEYELSILFISHDPDVINRVCDRVISL